MASSMAWTRLRSAGAAAATSAGGVPSTRAITWSRARCIALQYAKSEPTIPSSRRTAREGGSALRAAFAGGWLADRVGGAKVTSKANFGDGDMITVWDLAQAPITDGATYVIAGGDGKPSEITFRVLDTVPTDAEALAAKLIDLGCTAQLDVLSTAMASAEG